MLRLRRYLSDFTDITDSVAIIFGTLLAWIIVLEIGTADLHLFWARIVVGMIAVRGFATLITWAIDRKSVSEE